MAKLVPSRTFRLTAQLCLTAPPAEEPARDAQRKQAPAREALMMSL